MNDRENAKPSVLNHPVAMLLRLALMVPLIGIWLFDPIGIQSWTTAFGTTRENGLLMLSLIAEVGAIFAAFAMFPQPRRPLSIVVNIIILVTCTTSYLWGCFVGLWMGMEPIRAMLFTVSILVVAGLTWFGLRRYSLKH